MLRRRLILSLIPIFCIVVVAGLVYSKSQNPTSEISQLAHTDLPQSYRSADGSLTFQYPQGWIATNLEGARVDLENTAYEKRLDNPDAIRLEFSPPIDVAQFSMLGQGTTPAAMVQQSLAVGGQAAEFIAQGLGPLTTGTPNGSPDPVTNTLPSITDSVNSFSVAGRPAAWGRHTMALGAGIQIASMTIYIDVGNNHVVSIFAAPYNAGGPALLDRYQNTVLAIADTIKYSPPPTPTVNSAVNASSVALPQTYTGTVGGWGLGEITFNYPADWYVISLGPFIQNTQTAMNQQNLESGQMQAAIVDPGSNMASIKDWKDVTNCRANPAGVTAMAVVQKQLPSTPEDQQRMTQKQVSYSAPQTISINGKDAVLLRIHQNKTDVLLIDKGAAPLKMPWQ